MRAFLLLYFPYIIMRIKNPKTQNTWEVELEPELIDRISEINIDFPNEITIIFHDNSDPKSDTSV